MLRVQRVFNMKNVPSEIEKGTEKPKETEWPQRGTLEFKDVVLKYRPNTDVVL